MYDLMHKINLTRSLNVMRMLFPDEYDFYPKTWFLPEQNEQRHAIKDLVDRLMGRNPEHRFMFIQNRAGDIDPDLIDA